MIKKQSLKTKASIFVIWLFAISGVIGISSSSQDWFLALTPLNLLLSLLIVLWNFKLFNPKIILALAIPFVLGFAAEALGVNYGIIFGNYAYGENLGFKVLGVPLIICINWTLLTIITSDISKYLSNKIVISSLISAALMTGLDIVLEVSAPRFDFWEFDNGMVPLQNYIAWFVTSFIANFGYQCYKVESNKIISIHVFVSITMFFSIFLFI